jgi:hypothetical protein
LENLVVFGGEAEDGMGRDEAGKGCNAFNLLAIITFGLFYEPCKSLSKRLSAESLLPLQQSF